MSDITHAIDVAGIGHHACKECGHPLLNTPSGAVCSRANDCGRLLPKISSKAIQRNTAILSLGLRDATQVASGWIIPGDGDGVIYQKNQELSKKLANRKVAKMPAWLKDGQRLALEGHRVIVLEPGGSAYTF